jgi:uncharacterized protein
MAQLDMDRRVVPRLSRWLMAASLGVIAVPTLPGPPAVYPVWAQGPAPAPTNRLINSANPYLLQHSHNPVDWYPWGPEAIARAKAENRLIFLSIGYSTCYWCHVAERTVYADPAIAALMNAWFVNIKVDREERPDLDQAYMAVRHRLTGSAGWPNNIFLTPDLEPISATGHVPAEDQDGRPGFGRLLTLMHARWKANPEQLTAIGRRVHAAIAAQQQAEAGSAARPEPVEWLKKARAQLERRHDSLAGGFYFHDGSKFPLCPALDLLLADYRQNDSTESLQVAADALAAIAFGGIHDHLGGGVHRYSTEATWSLPHFEKMLYDNAQLLGLYAEHYGITRQPLAGAMVGDIARFLTGRLMSPDGGFYTAEDAEAEGKEGETYLWTRAQIVELLGAAEAERFFALYELTPWPGDAAGRGVLRVRFDRIGAIKDQVAAQREAAALAPLRAKLLSARDRRRQPERDEKIVVSLNGLAIEGLARAGRILANAEWITLAKRAGELIWRQAFEAETGRLSRYVFRGTARGDALLEDYAMLGLGYLALGDASGEGIWGNRARTLANIIVERFLTPDGMVRTTSDDRLFVLARDVGDQYAPSGTTAAFALLSRLGGSEERFAQAANTTLARMVSQIEAAPDRWASLVARASSAAVAPPTLSDSIDSAAHVKAVALRERHGDQDAVVVTLTIDPGYHINANPASLDYLMPTTIVMSRSPGAKVFYPTPKKFKPKFMDEAIDVYEGSVVATIDLPKGTSDAEFGAAVAIDFQACNVQTCLLPAKVSLPLSR